MTAGIEDWGPIADETIVTGDIVLAATLKTLGFKLIKIEKHDRYGEFTVEANAAILKNYELGQVRVEPIAFNSNIKQLATAAKRVA